MRQGKSCFLLASEAAAQAHFHRRCRRQVRNSVMIQRGERCVPTMQQLQGVPAARRPQHQLKLNPPSLVHLHPT